MTQYFCTMTISAAAIAWPLSWKLQLQHQVCHNCPHQHTPCNDLASWVGPICVIFGEISPLLLLPQHDDFRHRLSITSSAKKYLCNTGYATISLTCTSPLHPSCCWVWSDLCDFFSQNKQNQTKPSGCIITGDVAVREIVADLVLQHFFMEEVMWWRRRKSSWCSSIVTWFVFLGLCRNCYVCVCDTM